MPFTSLERGGALRRALLLASAVAAASGAGYSQTAPRTSFDGLHVRVPVRGPTCNAFAYGAVGDGVHDDTAALQAAITACATSGGGVTLLPRNGTFMSFGLTVPKAAMNFVLLVDGVLRFSNDTKTWPSSQGHCLTLAGSFIALTGAGILDGQGAAWWPCAKAGCFRPGLVLAQSVTDLLVANLTFKDSPNHQLELYAGPFEVVGVSILAPPSTGSGLVSHNSDGIDVHGSPAFIHDSLISTGDDHIAFHANDTLVTRVRFGTGHGASIGSLGAGTLLRNITVRDSSFSNPTAACRIKADTASSGYLRDVLYANLSVAGAAITIQVSTNYPKSGAGTGTLQMSNISFVDITSKGAAAAGEFSCSPNAPCRDFTISNVVHTAPLPTTGWICGNAHGTVTQPVTPPLTCFQS